MIPYRLAAMACQNTPLNGTKRTNQPAPDDVAFADEVIE
jgi:hypothetical protein